MKSKALFLFALLIIVGGFACSEKTSEQEYFGMAKAYMEQQNWEKAEEMFSSVLNAYPDGAHASESLFMVAYINANYTKNLEKARASYEKFLAKFPDSDLADDAQYELQHLGKNIDELPFMTDSLKTGDGQTATGNGGTPATN